MLQKVFDELTDRETDTSKVHILQLNMETGKLRVKTLPAIYSNNTCIVPDLNTVICLNNYLIKGESYHLTFLTTDSDIIVFLKDTHHVKKSILKEDKQGKIRIYTLIIRESLKECILRLTRVFKKTKSRDVGEKLNSLTALYERYTLKTPN